VSALSEKLDFSQDASFMFFLFVRKVDFSKRGDHDWLLGLVIQVKGVPQLEPTGLVLAA